VSLIFTLLPRGNVTRVERLAVISWLSRGYQVVAYTYAELDHMQRGVECGPLPVPAAFGDANAFVPEKVARTPDGLLAFKLCAWHAHGGLYMPSDYVMQTALPPTPHICGLTPEGLRTLTVARIPQDSPVLATVRSLLYEVDQKGRPTRSLAAILGQSIGLIDRDEAIPQEKLFPITREQGHLVARGRPGVKLNLEAYGTRLWPDTWDNESRSFDSKFAENALFERLWSIYFGASAHDDLGECAGDDSGADENGGADVPSGGGTRLRSERRTYGLPSRFASLLRSRGDF